MAITVTKSPAQCETDELIDFETLVIKGGEVNPEGLRNRIMKAECLVFLYSDDHHLIGVSALKRPNLSYKQKVFHHAGSSRSANEFTFELGWIFIEEESRQKGLSKLLMEELLKVAGNAKVYATTREKNTAMRKTNERFGFMQSGSAYQSDEGNYKLVLFTR